MRSVLLATCLVAVAGCAEMSLSQMENGVTEDSDAEAGDALETMGLRVDVLPPSGLTTRQGDPLQVAPHTFSANVGANLLGTLLPSVVTSGMVTGYAATPYAPMAALPGEEAAVLATVELRADRSVMGTSTRTEDDGFYLLSAAPSVYELAIIPEDPAYPLYIETDIVADLEQVLDLPIGSGHPVWGRILTADGFGLADVEVALRTPSGITGPSTWTDTDGRYTLWASSGEYHVKALGRDNGRDPVITTPTFSLDGLGVEVDVPYGSLDLISISGRMVRSSGGGIGSSTVRMTAQDLSGYTGSDASLVVEIPTDGAGNFDARLVSGSYRVELLPPSEASLSAVDLGIIDISSAVSLGAIELPAFQPLTGVAVDEDGELLASATIRATEVGFEQRFVETLTEEDGSFSMDVPVADLDLLLTPPGDRVDLAATRQRFSLGALTEGEQLIAVRGRTVSGRVELDDGARVTPLNLAVVQIYAEDGQALGQTLTNGAGEYTLQVDLAAYE